MTALESREGDHNGRPRPSPELGTDHRDAEPGATSTDTPTGDPASIGRIRLTSGARVARWLPAVLIGELILAGTLRAKGPIDLLHGEEVTAHRLLQLLGLLLAPLLAVTCVRIYRLARSTHDTATMAHQTIDDVLTVASEWIWTIDRDGTLLETNGAVTDILGYSSAEILGTSSFSLMHPDSRDQLIDALAASAAGDQGWVRRTSAWRHRDGSRRYLQSSATPVRDRAGNLTGFRGASRDVTVEAEANAANAAARREHSRKHGRIEQVLYDDQLLSPVYQPIVRIEDGRIEGIEALARFHTKPDRSPDNWFAEAADVGLGHELETLAIRRAAQAIGALSSDQYLSLNVSAATLRSEHILRFLLEPRVAAERIVLELTEHSMVGDYDELAEQLTKLRRLGARLAIDDAGAGYSSLHHILRLQPDFIKLDRALTTAIDTDPVRKALTSAMVTFARDVDAALIAEGVERHAELETLHAVGVPYAQGYLLGRPAPLHEWTTAGLLRRAVPIVEPSRTVDLRPHRAAEPLPGHIT